MQKNRLCEVSGVTTYGFDVVNTESRDTSLVALHICGANVRTCTAFRHITRHQVSVTE